MLLYAVPERLVGVGLCPPDLPKCGNKVAQKGASVGDACTLPCGAFGGGRWCPTTAIHSRDKDTPWGWCSTTGETRTVDCAPGRVLAPESHCGISSRHLFAYFRVHTHMRPVSTI